MEFLSISMKNRASFVCPIFDVTTQMRACVKLRDKMFMGQRVEVRRGCQACITSSKCPAANLVRRIGFNLTNATDEVSSANDAVVKLPADVLEEVLPVVVLDGTLARFGVTSEERSLIDSANERIAKQLATAPRNRKSAPKVHASVVREQAKRGSTMKVAAPAVVSEINKAAATGDMSAGIS